TSPTRRGKWVLGQLLCSEPPPPPPNIPPLPETTTPTGSLRQRLEAHRSNPVCASCHSSIDPIGFGLEHFDAVGRWRNTDTGGYAIDATGTLPGGAAFDGAAQLARALKQDPRVASCIAQKVFTYAIGRQVVPGDDP